MQNEMKKLVFVGVSALIATQLWSQDQATKPTEDRNFRIPLIGESAPSFTAESTNGLINFPGDFGRSWKILFSHPQDFTPVCSSEILELAHLQDKFEQMGVKIAVVSTDPLSMHTQWKKALESVDLNNEGKMKIRFPIIDDQNIVISKEYGMIHPENNSTRSVRGVFIIDPQNKIRAMYFYPNNVGRSTDEILRMVAALETTNHNLVATPVNWQEGQDVMIPYNPGKTPVTLENPPEGYYAPAWFMWYMKADKLTSAGK